MHLKTNPVELYWQNLIIEQAEESQKISSDVAELVFKITKQIDNDTVKTIDLGTGNGILSFMLEQIIPKLEITAIDIQAELINLAKKNKKRINSKVRFFKQDIRKVFQEYPYQKYDFIISNPPHLPINKYRISPIKMKAISRSEIKCNMKNIFEAVSHLLNKNGKAFLIYPIERDDDIMTMLKSIDLKLVNRIFSKSIENEKRQNKKLVCYVIERGNDRA
ncbi:MAG: methyltransferase domain-containing protein [Candidatus Cloacimonadota bacterium]|nr:methyltransferase domain-containing protein [Candidatus Cloacimonadota bacterium]